MQIVFSNQDFIVVDKPSGYLSVPSRFKDEDQRPVVGLKLQEQLGQVIFPVHRLDFEVSGLLLFAKNKKAHSQANSWFENKLIQKTYVALTTKNADIELPAIGAKFEWTGRLLRGKKRAYESPHGKPSLTYAEFKGVDERFLTWHLQPVTGRSHQLRVDLSKHGFPIVGDALYGSQESWGKESSIALRAFHLKFPDSAKDLQLPSELIISDQLAR